MNRNFRKIVKSLRRYSQKQTIFTRLIPFRSNRASLFLNSRKSRSKFIGNLEFSIFLGLVFYGLSHISNHNTLYSETTRLIAAGIATHMITDFLTYVVDKINTDVKFNQFYLKVKHKEIDSFFKTRFLYQFTVKSRQVQKLRLGAYMKSYRGIQSAIIFLTLNSILFYGIYKNLKHWLKSNLNIEGFGNFFIAAAVAQAVAMTFSFPLENLKTRMQASSFNYDSLIKYYTRRIAKGRIKKEYSGFISHLILYVVYEAITFGVYETAMELLGMLIRYFR